MFFFVDESGHTGKNLFDEAQPYLYYGVLSSPNNLEHEAKREVDQARANKGVERLHAAELGMGGLVDIHEHLLAIQEKHQLEFDIWRVYKPDHAVISFFDQVFDQGVNPAMTWSGYWTPLRYTLLLIVGQLFDEGLAKRAWKARINTRKRDAEIDLVGVCRELLYRLTFIDDARAKQLIGDSLEWVIEYPSTISYNCQSHSDKLDVMPNMIGFQSVMHGIAARLDGPEASARIVVDQQAQFNKAQKRLADFYAKNREVEWLTGPGLPAMDLSKIPTAPISFKSSKSCVGLELVDCYLWIFKLLFEGKKIADELIPIIEPQLERGNTMEVSLAAIHDRWQKLLLDLPMPTGEQLKKAHELRAMEESRRWRGKDPFS